MEAADRIEAEKEIPIATVLASLASFIPACGALIGLVCVIYALTNWHLRRAKVVLTIGLLGIASTVALYGTLFYQAGSPNSDFGKLERFQLSQQQLPQLVKSIEYFKLQNGRYPSSIAELPQVDRMPVELQGTSTMRSQGEIYYELNSTGDKYRLGAVGPDHKRHTDDDVLPEISEAEAARIGYTR